MRIEKFKSQSQLDHACVSWLVICAQHFPKVLHLRYIPMICWDAHFKVVNDNIASISIYDEPKGITHISFKGDRYASGFSMSLRELARRQCNAFESQNGPLAYNF